MVKQSVSAGNKTINFSSSDFARLEEYTHTFGHQSYATPLNII
jgi:hypothetical protein